MRFPLFKTLHNDENPSLLSLLLSYLLFSAWRRKRDDDDDDDDDDGGVVVDGIVLVEREEIQRILGDQSWYTSGFV